MMKAFLMCAVAGSLGLASMSVVAAEVDPNLKLEKQQLELQKQQLELERKQLELERKRLELERAKVPAAGAAAEGESEGEAVFKVKLEGDILFDFEQTELKPGAEKVLSTVVAVVSQFPTGKVFIDGHTDAKGKDSVNMEFSLRRADSVKKYLVKQGGVPAGQITTRGLGETRPIAANENPDGSDYPEGRALNRRVEITVTR